MGRERKYRRMSMSSPYIGSGNRTDTFNRKPQVPFKKLRAMYGDELENFITSEKESVIIAIELTEEERGQLKNKVRGILKQERQTSILSFIATISILIILIFLVFYFYN